VGQHGQKRGYSRRSISEGRRNKSTRKLLREKSYDADRYSRESTGRINRTAEEGHLQLRLKIARVKKNTKSGDNAYHEQVLLV